MIATNLERLRRCDRWLRAHIECHRDLKTYFVTLCLKKNNSDFQQKNSISRTKTRSRENSSLHRHVESRIQFWVFSRLLSFHFDLNISLSLIIASKFVILIDRCLDVFLMRLLDEYDIERFDEHDNMIFYSIRARLFWFSRYEWIHIECCQQTTILSIKWKKIAR